MEGTAVLEAEAELIPEPHCLFCVYMDSGQGEDKEKVTSLVLVYASWVLVAAECTMQLPFLV